MRNLPATFSLPPLPLAISGAEVVLVLLFLAGGLIKSLIDKAKGANDPTRPSPRTPPLVPPRRSSPPQRVGDQARKLREALGVPAADWRPPPSVAPPPLPSPPPVYQAGPPPLPVPPAQVRPADDEPRRRARKSRRPRQIELSSETLVPPVPAPSTGKLTGLLRGATRAELRRAVLLREVLGPPRSLVER